MNTLNNDVRLGYAEADITPDHPVECIGFGRRDNRSRGTLDPLMAQIVLWDDSKTKYCIVAIDSLGFTVGISNDLRKKVGSELGIPKEQVMLCFAHTHSAPNAAAEPEYLNFLLKTITAAVKQANDTLFPVKAAWVSACADIGVNRRNQNGQLDRRIGVLKITDAETGELKLLLLRLTAHANVLSSDNYLLSPDFFGAARRQLERYFGCKAVLTQGASGNVRPKYQHSMATWMEEHPFEAEAMEKPPELLKRLYDESMDALNHMAMEISTAVEAAIRDLKPQPVSRIAMFSETEAFPADVPTVQRAEEIAQEAEQGESIDGANWLAEVKRLRDGGVFQQYEDMEIQYFILNDGCLCGVPNEAMCEIALDIWGKVGHPFTFFGGYTNGCTGYLPTAEEYQKGGYEVLWSYLSYFQYHGHVMPLNSDTALKLAQRAADRLKGYFI